MRKAIGGHRRDSAEAAIVQALRAVGAQVEYCSGERAPDLLAFFRNRYFAIEVKTARAKRTASQRETNYPIARTPTDALAIIGAFRIPDVVV